MHYCRLKKHGDTGINYKAKYKKEPILHIDNIDKPETGKFNRLEEALLMNELFSGTYSVHEIEQYNEEGLWTN